MKRFPLLLLGALWGTPVWAAAIAAPQPGEVLAVPGGVAISAAPCQALLTGADYVPGVDAKGNEVAPADLQPEPGVAPADLPRGPATVKPDDIRIELDARLAARFGVPAGGDARLGRAVLGTITVRDGRAYFNGAPLAPDLAASVAAACAAHKK
jgi:hypothetical protein